jgi:hypothetical protein
MNKNNDNNDNNCEDDAMDEVMDVSWINQYEDEDKYYELFYPENAKKIKVSILYVNKKKELEKINEKMVYLNTENKITREEFVRIIKDNERMDKLRYKLLSIVIYNIELKHSDLRNYMNGTEKYDFITNLRNIEDYELRPTINCLQEINNLYVIFNEQPDEDKKLCSPSSSTTSATATAISPTTKRVRFSLTDKKTRRRRK